MTRRKPHSEQLSCNGEGCYQAAVDKATRLCRDCLKRARQHLRVTLTREQIEWLTGVVGQQEALWARDAALKTGVRAALDSAAPSVKRKPRQRPQPATACDDCGKVGKERRCGVILCDDCLRNEALALGADPSVYTGADPSAGVYTGAK